MVRKLIFVFLLFALTVPAIGQGYDEQERVFAIEQAIVNVLPPILNTLGDSVHSITPRAVGWSADLPHKWLLGDRNGNSRYQTWVEFKSITYVDGDSTDLGCVTSEPATVQDGSWSRRLVNDADAPNTDTVTVDTTLQVTKSSSYDVSFSFSVTNKLEVQAGDAATTGASATASSESTASSSFGANESAESSSTEDFSQTYEVEVPARTTYLVTFDKQRFNEICTVRENAYLDFEFDIYVYYKACDNSEWFVAPNQPGGRATYLCPGESFRPLSFDNMQDFTDFLVGKHPREHPGMDLWRGDQEFKRDNSKHDDGSPIWSSNRQIAGEAVNSSHWLENRDRRRVSLTRKDKKVYDNAGQIRTREE